MRLKGLKKRVRVNISRFRFRKKDSDELARLAKQLGYKSVHDFASMAVIEELIRARGKRHGIKREGTAARAQNHERIN